MSVPALEANRAAIRAGLVCWFVCSVDWPCCSPAALSVSGFGYGLSSSGSRSAQD